MPVLKVLISAALGPLQFQTFKIDTFAHRVLQIIQMKLILLCVWAEWAVLGSAKTALKFKYEI